MKQFGLFWKICILTLLILVSALVVFSVSRIYRNKYSVYSDNDYFNEMLNTKRFFDGSVRLTNSATGSNTTPRLEWIADPNPMDSTTVFSVNGKRGYLSTFTGKITIAARYRRAWKFAEGLGAVTKGNRMGFINSHGQEVIPFRYYFESDKVQGLDFQFYCGYCTAMDSTLRYGLINKQGKWVLAPVFSIICLPEYGYRRVKMGDKYGILDSTLRWVFPVEYDYISISENGFHLARDGSQQFISLDARTVIHPFIYDEIETLYYNSGKVNPEGDDIQLKSDFMAYIIHHKKGIMDSKGKVICKAIYDEINALTNTLFSCRTAEGWITLNAYGKIIQ
jgi:hypothetical protein